MLVIQQVPAEFALPLAIVPAALFIWLLRRGQGPVKVLTLAMGAAALALAAKGGFDLFCVAPVRQYAGRTAQVLARVEDVEPGYSEEMVHATLRVLELDGGRTDFLVQLRGIETVSIGDMVSADLCFYEKNATQANGYAKGQYIDARPQESPVVVGESMTFMCRMRQLRYWAGDKIRAEIPNAKAASVVASMAVGDRRTLNVETRVAYRAAGLSHVLVVSGLHLSILCGAVNAALGLFLRDEKLRNLLCCVFVLGFMAFTGFTVSIVRSGIMCLLVLVAPLFSRRPDTYTSLGFAALCLCLANPYAAADMGLQLSFAAAWGTLAGEQFTMRVRSEQRDRAQGRGTAVLIRVGSYFITPTVITLVTLPVLVAHGAGVSLLGVPMNLIAVPLLGPIVISGLLLAIVAGTPVLGFFASLLAVVSGGLAVLLQTLTRWCAGISWAYWPITGRFALVVIALLYLLGAALYRRLRRGGSVRRQGKTIVAYALVMGLVCSFSLLLHDALNRDVVRISIVGQPGRSSLVVTQNGQAAVIFLNHLSRHAVKQELDEQRIDGCALLVDLRKSAQSTGYEDLLSPDEVVVAREDVFYTRQYTPFEGEDVTIMVLRQPEGNLVCLDVRGYKVGTAAGTVDFSGYPAMDVIIAGQGLITGRYDMLVAQGEQPDWAAPEGDGEILLNEGALEIWIRPGTSVVFREAQYDI